MDCYKITLSAWRQERSFLVTTNSKKNAVKIARQEAYLGCSDLDHHISEGRVPVLNVEKNPSKIFCIDTKGNYELPQGMTCFEIEKTW